MNLGSLGQDSIAKYGEHDSFYFEGRWYTNVEMELNANRLGNALKSLGIRRGDRVAIQMPNSPIVLWSFPAIYKIGAVAVPMNPLLRPDQSAYIFQNCGAKVVITSPEYVPWIQAARKQSSELRNVIVTEKDNIPDTLNYDQLTKVQPDTLCIEDTENEDIAALIYTAGTTGPNKGVMHTHYSLYATATGFAEYMQRQIPTTLTSISHIMDAREHKAVEVKCKVTGVNRNRLGLLVLPLSHMFGLILYLIQTVNGGKSIIMKWFNIEEVLKTIQYFRVNAFSGVPSMYVMMLNHHDFDKYDLSSLQECNCGAAPLAPETGLLWKQKTGADICEGWGMTETCGTTCVNTSARPPRYGSIGICAVKANKVSVVDDDDREVKPGISGELVVKGPSVMKGYWKMPEETAETLRNGWMHTGDIGHMDEDGYFYITDRKKDIIIRGGENVSPREVEEVLVQIPQILEVGVIGVFDKTYGEEIKAFCVMRKDVAISSEEIIIFCKQKLPSFKVPKTVQFVDSLPKNLLGKLLRSELRKLEKQA